ncbi:ribonuclease HII, partial [Candidatus Pacearchaeota archaeon]
MFSLGVDDAGRGPIIGPMILAGVALDEKSKKELSKLGVKDSKALAHARRVELAAEIQKRASAIKVVKASPTEIDRALASGKNLNTLEAELAAKVVKSIVEQLQDRKATSKLRDSPKPAGKIKVVVDCPSANTLAWRAELLNLLQKLSPSLQIELKCEHKADVKHIEVSAASVIAKVEREKEMQTIRKKYAHLGEVGSGYPADPLTKAFLKKHGKKLSSEGIFRKSWETWKRLFPTANQKT